MKVVLVACFALLTVASGFPTVSQWTLQELSDAIQDPNTNPMLMPYIESALNDWMTALHHGYQQEIATIVIPADVAAAMNPITVEPVAVHPIAVHPVIVAPGVAEPVKPEEAAPVVPNISPLVQIILNINSNQVSAPGVAAPVEVPVAPVVTLPAPAPEAVGVAILPEAVGVANPVNPIDQVAVEPMPVNPIDQVAVEPMPVNPIDQVAVAPMPVNPIDQVAVSPIQVNPVDIIAPIGVVAPSTDGIHV